MTKLRNLRLRYTTYEKDFSYICSIFTNTKKSYENRATGLCNAYTVCFLSYYFSYDLSTMSSSTNLESRSSSVMFPLHTAGTDDHATIDRCPTGLVPIFLLATATTNRVS